MKTNKALIVIVVFAFIVLCKMRYSLCAEDLSNQQQMASQQEIQCIFEADVAELSKLKEPLAGEQNLKGCIINENPKWKLVLRVLSCNLVKSPFSPGSRTSCFIENPESVFGVPPQKVSGIYQFSLLWNIDVPGKLEFSDFKAKRLE